MLSKSTIFQTHTCLCAQTTKIGRLPAMRRQHTGAGSMQGAPARRPYHARMLGTLAARDQHAQWRLRPAVRADQSVLSRTWHAGALASALRKYARFGVLAGRRVWYTLARSAILQSAAELTFCLCTLPASRQYDLRSRAPRAIARAVIAETGITGCRLLMSTAGTPPLHPCAWCRGAPVRPSYHVRASLPP